MGKMLMSIDYIGDVITVLYNGYYFLVIATVVVTIITAAIKARMRRKAETC